MNSLHTAGLVILKNRKLLLAYSNNKRAFYLPGGKINSGETAQEALVRESKEELHLDIEMEDLKYYTHISAPAFGESNGLIMEQECYLYETVMEPQPGAEIASIRLFNIDDYKLETMQVPGVVMVMQQLKDKGWID